jgi:hypothetical protein
MARRPCAWRSVDTVEQTALDDIEVGLVIDVLLPNAQAQLQSRRAGVVDAAGTLRGSVSCSASLGRWVRGTRRSRTGCREKCMAKRHGASLTQQPSGAIRRVVDRAPHRAVASDRPAASHRPPLPHAHAGTPRGRPRAT